MISRQSFFKRLSAVVVAVALAPEIAFGTRLSSLVVTPPKLDLFELLDNLYALAESRREAHDFGGSFFIFTDDQGAAMYKQEFPGVLSDIKSVPNSDRIGWREQMKSASLV